MQKRILVSMTLGLLLSPFVCSGMGGKLEQLDVKLFTPAQNEAASELVKSRLFHTLLSIPINLVVHQVIPAELKEHKGKISLAVQALAAAAILDRTLFPKFMAAYEDQTFVERAGVALSYAVTFVISSLLGQQISTFISNSLNHEDVVVTQADVTDNENPQATN